MAWTNKQKQLAVQACRAAGIGEEQRRELILRHFENARYKGDVTSTSPHLTHQDFAEFMAIVERYAGGRILHFTPRYWQASAEDQLQRMRHRVAELAAELEACGRLEPGGAGLAGWISKRVSRGQADRVEELDFHQMRALILQLEAYRRQGERACEACPV